MHLVQWLRRFAHTSGAVRGARNRPRATNPGTWPALRLKRFEDRLAPAVLTVNTTADNNNGVNIGYPDLTLRDAILLVDNPSIQSYLTAAQQAQISGTLNVPGVPDTIAFNITADSDKAGGGTGFNAGTGVATISPSGALPDITAPMVIDGYTQGTACKNCLPNSDNAKVRIEIDGNFNFEIATGLNIVADGCTVRGLAMYGFQETDIAIAGSNNKIQGDFLGTDASGTFTPYSPPLSQVTASGLIGVTTTSGTGNLIGTNGDGVDDPAERNIIAGNNVGVVLYGPSSSTVIAGNFIGTDITGTKALPNWAGVGTLLAASNDRVGTNGTDVDASGERNVISGNALAIGFGLGGNNQPAESNGLVAGNYIGLAADGSSLPNAQDGIFVGLSSTSITIGGSQAVMANTIANNQGPGVWVVSFRGTPTGIRIQGNSIYDNTGPGIVIGGSYPNPPTTVTLNGSQTGAGPNNWQYYPELSTAVGSATDTTVTGTFSDPNEPNQTITLDFYANGAADRSAYSQAQTYLGSATATTDANGNASFAVDLPAGNLSGQWISATATDTSGDTSEFNADMQVSAGTFASQLQTTLPQSTSTPNVLTVGASPSTINTVVAALSPTNLGQQVTAVSVYLNLSPGTYGQQTVRVPAGMTLYINGTPGTTIDPDQPAFTVTSGNVVVSNVTFTTTGDAPTILVTGGSLTLRNCVVQESTGFTDAAIMVTGGALDLGEAGSPGDDVLNINGQGEFFSVAGGAVYGTFTGDTFAINGYGASWGGLPDILSSLPMDSANRPTAPAGSLITLTSDVLPSLSGGMSYVWSVTGAYTPGSASDPSTFAFTPQFSGPYAVTLSIVGQGNTLATTSQTIDVTPVAAISRSPTPVLQGQRDLTFGTGGIQTTSVGPLDDEATNVFAQPDGKLLVVGYTYLGDGNYPLGNYALTISRYLPNGSLDPSYGQNGTSTTSLTYPGDPSYAPQGNPPLFPNGSTQLAMQSDGSLLILWGNQLLRYRPDGSPDSGFGDNGTLTLSDFDYGDQYGNAPSTIAIALQPDGKILLAGAMQISGPSATSYGVADTLLERLNPDGCLDPCFGNGGRVKQDLGIHESFATVTLDESSADALAVQPDGAILVGGFTADFNADYTSNVTDDGFVARFDAHGNLDTSFGSGGEVVLVNPRLQGGIHDLQALGSMAVGVDEGSPNSSAGDLVSQLLLQPDGKCLVVLGSGYGYAAIRLNANGTVDRNFAPHAPTDLWTGAVPPGWPEGWAASWHVDGAGRLLVASVTLDPNPVTGTYGFTVSRYNPDGTPDSTFGSDSTGTTSIDFGSDAFAADLAIQGDGNIVVVGTSYDTCKQGWDAALVRLTGQPGPTHTLPGLPITLYPALPAAGTQTEAFAYTWSVSKDGTAFALSSSTTLATVPSFTFTPDTSGTYVATLTVTDQSGFTASATSTLLVNAPPTVGASPNLVNLPLSAWDLLPANQLAGFTYTVDWGDGTPETQIARTASNGSGTSSSHTYSTSGICLATITATDAYGFMQSTSDVIVIGSAAADDLNFAGGPNPEDVQINLNGTPQTLHPADLVFASGMGGGDTYTVNFGSNLTTPIVLAGGGSSSGDTLIVNGDNSNTNVISKTPGLVTWGSPVTETVFRSAIPHTTINANGTQTNYVNDPGGNTVINGGPGANFITITATSGNGVVINGGPSSNTYTVDFGSLAGPVAIQNSNTGATNQLVINGTAGDNTITLAGNQITEGAQTITDSAPLANLTVTGGSGNNQLTVSGLTMPTNSVTLVGGSGTNSYTVGTVAGGTAVGIVAGTVDNILTVTGSTVPTITAPAGATVPIVFAHSYSIFDNGVLNVAAGSGLLVNDLATVPGGLTAVLAQGPSHGTVTVHPDGSFTYTPAANYVGSDSFTYEAKGGNGALSSAAIVAVQIGYQFGGFLAPLNSTLAMGLGRTVPVKFQLTDANGHFLTSLSAVNSLQVLNAQGANVLTNTGSTALRYDSTSNQFVANWQTKGLPAGSYTVQLALADGTIQTKVVQLTTSGASSGLETATAGGSGTTPGGLLGGDVALYVDNSNGDLTPDELARIEDAVAAVDATIAPYGVTITEVNDPTLANVALNMNTTSAVGGYADGVLGCTTDSGQVTIIAGWSFYAGSDATQIGAGQYDFQTVVTHELGHVLGLGHSNDATSVMDATLDTGAVKRTLVVADLNVPDTDGGACGLHVGHASPDAATRTVLETDGLLAGLARGPLAKPGFTDAADSSAAVLGTRPSVAGPRVDPSVGNEPARRASDSDSFFAELGADTEGAAWGLADWQPWRRDW